MNKFIRTLVICAVVIAVHLIIWAILCPSSSPETESSSPKQPAESAPQTPSFAEKDIEAPAVETKPLPQPPEKEAIPTLSAHFTQDHFKKDLKQLPQKLATRVGKCRAALVIDLDNRTILWEKNPEDVYPMASLTKMLTAIVLMEKIRSDSTLSMDTQVKVTQEDIKLIRKEKINGIYMTAGESLSLDDYLKAMIICSSNDAAIVSARFIGDGDYEAGLEKLRKRAAEMGLKNITLYNANGLPVDTPDGKRLENQGSALELAFLAEGATQYPEIMKWAGIRRESVRKGMKNQIDLTSTNHLLRAVEHCEGVTGLKTGYTRTAGYCMALTACRENRNLLVLVTGVLPPPVDYGKERDAIVKALLEWGYTTIQNP